MEYTLLFDLNEIVSERINEELASLKETIRNQSVEILSLRKEARENEVKLSNVEHTNILLLKLRENFNGIASSKPDESGWYNSKQKNQYTFIKTIMNDLFGVTEQYGGWKSHRGDGTLKAYLAVNFYDHKDAVINLLKVLKSDSKNDIQFINDFVMPYDYPKEMVLEYVKSPQYNTNGAIFDVSNFWIESGCGKSNMPHNLIMKNPHIVSDDVFSELINSINKKVSEYNWLFSVGKYNENVGENQIQMLGECLVTTPTNKWSYDNVKEFINRNLTSFNKTTLDFLYSKISDDNQFSMLHWEKFPVEYQYQYLMDKPIKQILKLLENYSCKWTDEEKEVFLKQYFLNKK